MKRVHIVFNVLFLVILFNFNPVFADMGGLDFGNRTSTYLVQKAWASSAARDFNSAAIYANKAIELYSDKAKQMQANLSAYPAGSAGNIFQYWALNDVGTALYILGEDELNAGKKQEAMKTFQEIIDDYSYAQCWDIHGWFWKPASVAKDKLVMAAMGANIDFGNYNSSFLVQKAWGASAKEDLKSVTIYVNKIEELYGAKAKEMQDSLKHDTDAPLGYKQNTFNYWALNDVGTALFILADTNYKAGHRTAADIIYRRVIKEFYYAQCAKPLGGFWTPAKVAQKRLEENRSRQSIFGF